MSGNTFPTLLSPELIERYTASGHWRGETIYALGELCSHLAGPLADGEVTDCSLACPWHGSRFNLRDGQVLDGPATYPQPTFETRIKEGQIQVRAA